MACDPCSLDSRAPSSKHQPQEKLPEQLLCLIDCLYYHTRLQRRCAARNRGLIACLKSDTTGLGANNAHPTSSSSSTSYLYTPACFAAPPRGIQGNPIVSLLSEFTDLLSASSLFSRDARSATFLCPARGALMGMEEKPAESVTHTLTHTHTDTHSHTHTLTHSHTHTLTQSPPTSVSIR